MRVAIVIKGGFDLLEVNVRLLKRLLGSGDHTSKRPLKNASASPPAFKKKDTNIRTAIRELLSVMVGATSPMANDASIESPATAATRPTRPSRRSGARSR